MRASNCRVGRGVRLIGAVAPLEADLPAVEALPAEATQYTRPTPRATDKRE